MRPSSKKGMCLIAELDPEKACFRPAAGLPFRLNAGFRGVNSALTDPPRPKRRCALCRNSAGPTAPASAWHIFGERVCTYMPAAPAWEERARQFLFCSGSFRLQAFRYRHILQFFDDKVQGSAI